MSAREWTVKRQEEKYLVNAMQAAELRMLLNGLLPQDSHGRGDAYFIRSLYFDTPDDRDLADKQLGVFCRQKLRLRLYDVQARQIKLELKQKEGSASCKQSCLLDRPQARQLAEGNHGFLAGRPEAAARKAYALFQSEYRRPAVLIDYERTAFTLPVADVRITLDERLRAARSGDLFAPELPVIPMLDAGLCVLEVKYNGFLPAYLRQVLSCVTPLRLSVSKYEIARRLLR